MNAKRAKNQQKSERATRSLKDPRLANRAKAIRAQLRRSRKELAGSANKRRAELVGEILASTAEHRLRMTKWADLERTERDVLSSVMAAASLVALDCGMTRAEFVQWLRDGADYFDRGATW